MPTITLSVGNNDTNYGQVDVSGTTVTADVSEWINATGNVKDLYFLYGAVGIAQGEAINSAKFRIRNDGSSGDSYGAVLYCNDADNGVAPTSTSDWNAKSKTSAGGSIAEGWASGGAGYYEFDITTPVQEVVNRLGWSTGNTIMVMLDATFRSGGPFSSSVIDETNDIELVIEYGGITVIPLGAESDAEATLYASSIFAPPAVESESQLTSTVIADTGSLSITINANDVDRLARGGNDGFDWQYFGFDDISGVDYGFIRFTNVDIPASATITSAKLTAIFSSGFGTPASNSGRICAVTTSQPIAKADDAEFITNKTNCTPYDNWELPLYASPQPFDLTGIVQYYVNRADWVRGSSTIGLLGEASGTSYFVGGSSPVTLNIEFYSGLQISPSPSTADYQAIAPVFVIGDTVIESAAAENESELQLASVSISGSLAITPGSASGDYAAEIAGVVETGVVLSGIADAESELASPTYVLGGGGMGIAVSPSAATSDGDSRIVSAIFGTLTVIVSRDADAVWEATASVFEASFSVTPSSADSESEVTGGSVYKPSTSSSPTASESESDASLGGVVYGSLSLTSAADAEYDLAINVVAGSMSFTANASSEWEVTHSFAVGSITIASAAASVEHAAIAPSTLSGSLSSSPLAAEADREVSKTLLLGSQTFAPASANGDHEVTNSIVFSAAVLQSTAAEADGTAVLARSVIEFYQSSSNPYVAEDFTSGQYKASYYDEPKP